MAKLVLDLHDIYNKGNLIDKELNRIIDEAIEKKLKPLKLFLARGLANLKESTAFFKPKTHSKKYHRLDKDSKNFGRLFVYF